MQREFDVVVIGAGPAGEIAAGRLAEHGGMSVAIVERELVGGQCSFYACMPSKALLRPGELLAEARRVPGVAEAVTGALDPAAVLQRRDEVISGLDDGDQVPWLEQRGIELIRGAARLDGERRVLVGDDLLLAREAVVIAVGSVAAMPPIPGLAEVGAWSSRELTTAQSVPARLLVLGGGVVGAELAQAWGSLGSSVTLIEGGQRLIAREEVFASDQLQAALEAEGVEVLTGVKATGAAREGAEVSLELDDGRRIAADHLLVAVGREPWTEGLGLDSVGLKDGQTLEVDDAMRVVGAAALFAVGDVNGRSLLTHSGKYQARIAADQILGRRSLAHTDTAGAPRVIFTDPQIASVGEGLDAARERGLDVEVVDLATDATPGASFHGRGTGGTTRFLVDNERGVLIGATFVGFDVAELLQAATIAVVGEVPLSTLAHAVAAFPTRSELWLKLIEQYESQREVSVHDFEPLMSD